MKSLESLVLDSTAVTGAGMRHLRDLPRLVGLGLRDTKISDDDMAEVSAKLTPA